MTEAPPPRRRMTDAIGTSRAEVLRRRAAKLARPDRDDRPRRDRIEVVEFRVAGERYGIETSYVREVFQVREITPVPCTPPFILGIINVRGRILSVLGVRKLFDLPEREGSEGFRVLILESGTMEFSMLADEIEGITRVSPGDLQAALPTLVGVKAEYLKGITPDRLILLDAGRMLADPALTVHEEVSG